MRKLNFLLKAEKSLRSSFVCRIKRPPQSLSLLSIVEPQTGLCNPCRLHQCLPSFPTTRGCAVAVNSFCSVASFTEGERTKALPPNYEKDEEVAVIDEWEEEDDAEPELGDGGDGGGIVLQNVPWGDRVLSIANEILQDFGEDMKLFAFKISHRGYIYVRLDKLTNEYGCPSMEEIENYSRQYKQRLDDEGSKGDIPENLALEVSSPGAERLLRIPDDLDRFIDFPMNLSYVEDSDKSLEKSEVFFLDSIEWEACHCVWKLADVRENRDPSSKGRPMNRKLRDWRLVLPFAKHKKVTLYLKC